MTSPTPLQLAHKLIEGFKAHRRGQTDKHEKELVALYSLSGLSKEAAEEAAKAYLEAIRLSNEAIAKENAGEMVEAQQDWLSAEEAAQAHFGALFPAQKISDFTEAKKELVTAVHLLLERNDGKFLFLKRSATSTYAPGLWHVPGGVIEWGQTLHQTVIRELQEETGISWNGSISFAFAGEHRANSAKMDAWLVDMYVYGKLNGDQAVKLSKEHESFRWLTLVEAQYLEMVPELKEKLREWAKKH